MADEFSSIRYYDRDGNDVLPDGDFIARSIAYGAMFEDHEYRVVAETIQYFETGPIRVSTIWLGLDHSFGVGDIPVIFETVVFDVANDLETDEHYSSIDGSRYCTEQEALIGHNEFARIMLERMSLTALQNEHDESK